MGELAPVMNLTAKDFASDQEVRWCPGCGDYAILKALQRTMPEFDLPKENFVFVSGIGCAARFPYYMSTYGFHTIHGRAPAFATGIKLVNSALDVWVIMGDGDGLSIGGNHLLHALRRNVDLQLLLFNNEIYGLTKGQYSPTSRRGTRSPSTPTGSVESPVSACAFALGAGARFVARSVDTLQRHLPEMFRRAHTHRGASFLEVIQNCNVYNDRAFADFTDKDIAADNQIHVEHGKRLIFGKDGNRGLRITPGHYELEPVIVGENGVTLDDIVVHDETDKSLANLLVALETPDFPVALGVIYCDPAPTYDASVRDQIEEASRDEPVEGVSALMRHGRTWTVEPDPDG